ncbi:MAG: AraC family transcriptional regulator N-terminal domain-containing protein [Thermoanaerobaculia bacterium]
MDARQPYSDIRTLAKLIASLAPYEGSFELRLPGVHAVRVSHANEELTHYVQRASLGIIAQGAKVAIIGDSTYGCEAGHLALYSIDVPVASRVTRASAAEPYLVMMLDLAPAKLAELSLKVFPHGIPQVREALPLKVAEADRYMIDAATRLLELMARPSDAALLAPLAVEEILIRVLRSSVGSRLAQVGQAGSSIDRIASAVRSLRAHFDQPVSVQALAALANMSVTSFHRQFKAVTGMSPLQYQKALRLQEARRLMLTAMLDTGAAGRRVGYASPSQFSREYTRFFGRAPTRDINRLREEGVQAVAAPS